MPYRLRMFGGWALLDPDGERMEAVQAQSKGAALLTYLAALPPGQPADRGELYPLLWPERQDRAARNALSSALSRLRRKLPEGALGGKDENRAWVDDSVLTSDVRAFGRALEEGRQREALALYRGPFLDHVRLTSASPFNRWADEKRDTLRRRAYEAALTVGKRTRADGTLDEAETAYRRALDLEPLKEDAAAGLIRVLAEQGERAEALQLYEAFSDRLEKELDLSPSEELAELAERVRSRPGDLTDPAPAGEKPPKAGRSPSGEERSPAGWRNRAGLAAAVLVAGLAAAGLWLDPGPEGPAANAGNDSTISDREARPTVAVLPFQVSGAAADTWRDGMVSLLSTNLDGVSGLRTIADRTVFAELEQQGADPGETSTDQALQVARGVGAEYAVVGSASQLGGELQLTARLHEVRSRDRLGQVEVRGPADSITAMTDRLTRQVLSVLLDGSDEAIPSVDLARLTTRSLPALKSFLAGERHLRAAEYEAAIEDFKAAVEADSTFALAYQRLSRANGWALGHGEAEKRSARRAYRLADRLPEREREITEARYLRRVERRSPAAADSLRELTQQYPDDPVLWYQLGEVLWHGDVPDGWPEADRAFERAIELDPGHAIYYPHHAQLGIAVRHDSALAAERIERMPRKDWRRAYRIPLDLAFGSPDTRKKALARLDTISLSPLRRLGPMHSLSHPAERDAFETMFERLRRRQGSEEVIGEFAFRYLLVQNSLLQGQVQEGLARLEDWQPRPMQKSCPLAYSISVGISVPDTTAAAAVVPSSLDDDPSYQQLRCAAIYLIERGREDEVDPLLAAIREGAGVEEGDTLPRRIQWSINEVEGYRAWKAGNLQEAARRLSGGTPGANSWLLGTGGIWLGDIYREMGERETAEGWYRAAWPHPVAHEHLGRLYEEMGRPEEAAAAYRRFIAAWEDADEELQPRVEEARERLKALTSGEGETDE